MLKFSYKDRGDDDMAKINIISNISSKKHAGSPFYILDHREKFEIDNDKIVFFIEGEHIIQIGYLYVENTDGGQLINYDENICPKEDEEWYLYKVPLLLDGKGKMKKISKTRFALEVAIRNLVNSWLFLIIVLLGIVAVSFLM